MAELISLKTQRRKLKLTTLTKVCGDFVGKDETCIVSAAISALNSCNDPVHEKETHDNYDQRIRKESFLPS